MKWSELGAYQERFAESFGELLIYARSQGIKVRIKDAYRDPRLHGEFGEKRGYGAAHSVHKVSLAIDLYTQDDNDHVRLHDFWDSIGGAKRIVGDLGHYSFEWMGRR
jgi:hypothetical protein